MPENLESDNSSDEVTEEDTDQEWEDIEEACEDGIEEAKKKRKSGLSYKTWDMLGDKHRRVVVQPIIKEIKSVAGKKNIKPADLLEYIQKQR